MKPPLCIDLFGGLGGWAEGFIAEGYDVVGFDIERHQYGNQKYPGQLVLQDVLAIHGWQFKDADCIVASPPCQQYSWLAMPWSRSKSEADKSKPCGYCGGGGRDLTTAHSARCPICDGSGHRQNSEQAKILRHKWETEGPDNRLFDACFRIQREAILATGIECPDCDTGWPEGRQCGTCKGIGAINTRHIPLIVENVRGAQPWVGRSAWNFGSFHLWGDVPALMPIATAMKVPGFRFDGSGKSFQTASVEATGVKGTSGVGGEAPAGTGNSSWFFGKRADPRDLRLVNGEWVRPDGTTLDGTKIGGDWFSDPNSTCRKHSSRSQARKAASAQIAKIPLVLSRHIASVYYPKELKLERPDRYKRFEPLSTRAMEGSTCNL